MYYGQLPILDIQGAAGEVGTFIRSNKFLVLFHFLLKKRKGKLHDMKQLGS